MRDLSPTSAGTLPGQLTNADGTLFLEAYDRAHGAELWRSDGTRAGTRLVRDISPGSEPFGIYGLTTVDGTLFFVADDLTHGYELWSTDGTEAGTALVRDIRPGGDESQLSKFTNGDGTLFLEADDGTHGPELWRSDGTEAGTTLVRDIFPGSAAPDSHPYGFGDLTNVDGTFYFQANDGAHGFELWRSDGTEDGTSLVRDLTPGGVNSDSEPEALTEFGGALFFVTRDSFRNSRLWRSDGTEAGTVPIHDLKLGHAAAHLREVGGTLFFTSIDPIHGRELWRSDGTPKGTKLLRDIRPGEKSSVPYDAGFSGRGPLLTNAAGTLFFAADDGIHGVELWRSDGTRAGTRLVDDIRPGKKSSRPRNLKSVGRRLFFVANEAGGGSRSRPGLWKVRP